MSSCRGNSILMFFLPFCYAHDGEKKECGVGSFWVLGDIQFPVIFSISFYFYWS
jgi:hypothetical protein